MGIICACKHVNMICAANQNDAYRCRRKIGSEAFTYHRVVERGFFYATPWKARDLRLGFGRWEEWWWGTRWAQLWAHGNRESSRSSKQFELLTLMLQWFGAWWWENHVCLEICSNFSHGSVAQSFRLGFGNGVSNFIGLWKNQRHLHVSNHVHAMPKETWRDWLGHAGDGTRAEASWWTKPAGRWTEDSRMCNSSWTEHFPGVQRNVQTNRHSQITSNNCRKTHEHTNIYIY